MKETVKRLDDQVAIITCAGSGVGKEIALLFAQHGARILAADIDERDGEETVSAIVESGGEAIFARTDVSVSTMTGQCIQI